MKAIRRWVRAWRLLPRDERRIQAARVLDRLLRRHPVVRRLDRFWDAAQGRGGLRPDADGRGPLCTDLAPRARLAVACDPERARALLDTAARLLRREFDLLGSGPCRPLRADGGIDWHVDVRRGSRFSADAFHTEVAIVRGDGSDVKGPWELSRFQHLLVLGQAWHLAPLLLAPDEANGLRERIAAETMTQIDDWIATNPRGVGVHWTSPLEVAMRAQAWCATLALLGADARLGDAFLRRWIRSLRAHGRHVRAHLETGEGGVATNHYLGDILGLYAVSLALPGLAESAAWRAYAREALIREIDRQILDDGADFERSIPYHRFVVEMLVHGALLAEASGEPMPASYLRRLEGALEFIACYTRPDGSAPQIGDNDDGRLLPLDGYASTRPHDHTHLLALGGLVVGRGDLAALGRDASWEAIWLLGRAPAPVETPRTASRAFPASGFHVLRGGDIHVVVACGPVGTRGLGNHTHNDLGAPCVFAAGREWITDPGTGVYTSLPDVRNRFRSAGAHATIGVEGAEPNPFGTSIDDLFRMTEAASPRVTGWDPDEPRVALAWSAADAAGAAWHFSREIAVDGREGSVVMRDVVEPTGSRTSHTAFGVLRFSLSPGVTAVLQDTRVTDDGRSFLVVLGDADARSCRMDIGAPGDATLAIVDAPYSPRYGVVTTSASIAVRFSVAAPVAVVTWLRFGAMS